MIDGKMLLEVRMIDGKMSGYALDLNKYKQNVQL